MQTINSIMQREIHHFKFSLPDLSLDVKQVAALMGYQDDIPEMIIDMIQREIQYVQDANDINGGYIVLPVTTNPEEQKIEINNLSFQVGKTISNMLHRSDSVAVFACTAGKKISERAKYLMNQGNVLEGYVVDVIGSVAVEKTMDIIHHNILKKQCFNENLKITNRYSPGYCEWNIADQHKLFSLLPNNFCGITLTQSALMLPVKSLSGVVGIGANVGFHKYTCDTCTQAVCIYRNKKQVKK